METPGRGQRTGGKYEQDTDAIFSGRQTDKGIIPTGNQQRAKHQRGKREQWAKTEGKKTSKTAGRSQARPGRIRVYRGHQGIKGILPFFIGGWKIFSGAGEKTDGQVRALAFSSFPLAALPHSLSPVSSCFPCTPLPFGPSFRKPKQTPKNTTSGCAHRTKEELGDERWAMAKWENPTSIPL